MADERVVVVTGAAQGIGLACARRFARKGCRVVLADTQDEAGREAAEELGEQALYVNCNLKSRLAIHNLVAEAVSAFGGIDVLVNNATVTAKGSILDQDEDEFDRVLAVNLKGPFLLTQAAARAMVEQIAESEERQRELRRRYAIVNVASIQAEAAGGDQLAYSISHGALAEMTRACALALAPHHIRVNGVSPGVVKAGEIAELAEDKAARARLLSRTPLARLADPDEIANVVGFLASGEASYLTGEIIVADGGRLALGAAVETGA